MSSMRNAAPRRPHRERAQPQGRSKWGLLEKHKDYSLRAADYNLKKKKLGILSQKIREKNPDEFAFGMLSTDKAKAGKHGRGDGSKNKLDHSVVEKLKGQDSGYLRTILSRNRKEMDKVKQEIGLDSVMKTRGRSITDKENSRSTTFTEDGQPERKKRMVAPSTPDSDEWASDEETAAHDDLEPTPTDEMDEMDEISMDLDSTNMVTDDKLSSEDEDAQSKPRTKKQLRAEVDALARHKLDKRRRKKIREARATKLEILIKRRQSIMAAASELELQRAKMARTIGGTNKNGVKFKVRERKR